MKNNPVRIVAFIFNIFSCITAFFYGCGCIIGGFIFKAAGGFINSGDVVIDNPDEIPVELLDMLFTFGAVVIIVMGFICLISLAWMIPMTVRVAKMKNLGTAFKVCNLLFVNIISGILLLIDTKNPEDEIDIQTSTN